MYWLGGKLSPQKNACLLFPTDNEALNAFFEVTLSNLPSLTKSVISLLPQVEVAFKIVLLST